MSRPVSVAIVACVACVATVACVALGGCSRGKSDASASADADADADASAGAGADAEADAEADASADADADDELAYLGGVPRGAKGIGHTSVVFKIELSTGKKAAFKPASRRGPVRYKGEIAARRLGIALGLSNVPRAFFRSFEAAPLASAKGGDEMLVREGSVKGALMPWIDGLSFLALEQPPLAGQWKLWLRKGETVPDDQKELARQISTLVAFDFVTANWDRWSGGNVGIDKASGTLLYIDNDGAFFEVPPAEGLQRNKKLLEGVDKFSLSFVARLRALDDDALDRALGDESPGVPLLSTKALAGVHARRAQLLRLIDAKSGDAGADATLAFP
ncbi:MAG: hypothetical protein QOI41_5446 [Myxococcales bacterium]|nr:hypothetical protein [Myxococcales bacterium]